MHVTPLAIVVALLACLLALTRAPPAQADANAAVCARTYGKSDGLSCNFATHEQCRAAISGLAGSCVDNPYHRQGSPPARPRKRG